jgi:hypothetical protein
MRYQIDTTFDFRSDTPSGKDPDALSPTLRMYHKHLWSKPLPSGVVFDLNDTTPNAYLHHRSELGRFVLSSDSVIPSFSRYKSMSHIVDQVPPDEISEFKRIGYTIGGMMIFPGNRIDGKNTINGARGMNRNIRDRFDLTVECIRRHYLGQESPLSDVLYRYKDFFGLFGDLRRYAEFFLLQDIVSEDSSTVRFFAPFDDFRSSALPESVEAYRTYKKLSISFIEARNYRIRHFA